MSGTKHDTGKLPYDLIAPEALQELAKVLKFGASKYSTEYETEWDRLLSAPNVTSLEVRTPEESVVLVTKRSLEELILNSQKDKDRIVGIGRNAILTKLRNTPNVGKMIQNLVQETLEPSGSETYKNTDSLKSGTYNSVKGGAKFAEQLNICTLTIATTQGNFEVSCALNTTMDSDFWETIWKDLGKQFNISKPLNVTGARNWEQGMDWSRVFAALQRHTWAWWSGVDKDDETGYSHLSHALCCLMFLSAYEQRGVGKDDRHKIAAPKEE